MEKLQCEQRPEILNTEKKYSERNDIVWTVYHLVIYMQSNKIHKVIFNE